MFQRPLPLYHRLYGSGARLAIDGPEPGRCPAGAKATHELSSGTRAWRRVRLAGMISTRTRLGRKPGGVPGLLGASVALAGALLLAAAGPAAAQERPVDLELVLAVDASASVSDEEFDLQVRGLAEAFRHRSVAQAIRAAGDLGLAVALIQWADYRQHAVSVDWTLLHDAASARRFAKRVEAVRRSVSGGTAIGGALEFATLQLEGNEFQGRRKVVDVSGDGRSNQGLAAWLARNLAAARGITVNGLAILNEDATLDRYYRSNVIGGTGAFVMTANDYEAYRLAILSKLIREIIGAPTALGPVPPGRPAVAARD